MRFPGSRVLRRAGALGVGEITPQLSIPLTGGNSAIAGRADVGLCRQKWLFRGVTLGSKPISPLSRYL